MPDTTIHGIKVNGVTYQYDYDYLANKPLPATPASDGFLKSTSEGVLSWATPPTGASLPATPASDGFLKSTSAGVLSWDTPPSGTTLPAAPASDKFLKSNSAGVLSWDTPPTGASLPATPASDGFLKSTSTGVLSWATPPAGTTLPSHTSSDKGKFLGINSSNNLSWMADKIPAYNGHANEILAVNYSGIELEWVNARQAVGIPVTQSVNYVLVNASGLQWKDPETLISGGGGGGSSLPTCYTEGWIIVNTSDGPTWADPSDSIFPTCNTEGWVLACYCGPEWVDPATLT